MHAAIFNQVCQCKALRRTRLRGWICLISSLAILLLLPSLRAQTTGGTITGSVVDSRNALIPNASVKARNEDQKTVTEARTDSQGHFVFPLLLPGNYSISVEAPGFKSFERTGIVLNANSLLTVDQIRLDVGGASQTVTVQSQRQELDADTAARTDSIVGEQVQNIQVNGQSPLYFLGLTPGVAPTTGNSENSQQYNCCTVNGGTGNQLHVTVNGGSNEDTGGNSGWMAPVSLDAVQEIKVLTNSYEAEYGRAGGAQISIVTKSGTSSFHGSGFEYFRDRSMNANSWTNDRVGLPKSAYHYNDTGFNVGGPVFFKGFNKDKSKLFFFVDEIWQHQLVPNGQQQVTMPTTLERAGDFSKSVDQNGNPVTIIDPTTGQPFEGNVIPSDRIYTPGLALLNFLPTPNSVDASHPNYNYVSQASTQHPRREDNFRIDYNPSQSWRFYGSFLKATDNEASPYGIWGYSNVPLYTFQYSIPGYHYVLSATKVISPTAVNEVSYVQGHDGQYNGTRQGSSDWTMTGTNITLPTLYSPYSDFLPGFGFGGTKIGNSPNLSGSLYFYNANTNIEVFDNFSKTIGSHFLKLGVYFDHNWKVQPSGATYDGSYNFGDDSNNPLDSGFGFANAALGVFDSFSQASNFSDGYPLYKQWEFYAQDTWKVNRRLTVSYGMRFYSVLPVHNTSGSNIGQFSNFIPGSWSSSQAPVLLRPTIVNGQKVAIDPTTGQTYPAVDIGGFLSGDALTNGIKVLGTSYITKNPAILPAPRIGISYLLNGQGDIVLHLGAGTFYNRTSTDTYDSLVGNPPATIQAQVNYGNVASLTSGSSIYSPPGLSVWNTSSQIPVTYNYNLGIQMRLPEQMIGDIAYVGATQNHQQQSYNLNYVPFGAAFLPQNQDPTATNSEALPGSNALPANFMRPYTGFNSISYNQNSGNSNYNALQASLKRRVSTGLFLGVAYTWGKCLGTQGLRWDNNTHLALYSNCGSSISQDLTINYVYAIPTITKWIAGGIDNKATRMALGGWQLSGVSTFTTGTPYSVSMNIPGVSGQNFTGTPDQGPVLLCTGDPKAGTSSSPYNRLNANAFTIPAIPSIGIGCKPNNLFGPGIEDWDMSLQKTFPITERVALEIRGQAFNVFNHPQFTGVNSTINYSSLTDPTVTNNATGTDGTVTNINGFGSVSGVASPRVLELVGKLRF
jgi:hypothetical protein